MPKTDDEIKRLKEALKWLNEKAISQIPRSASETFDIVDILNLSANSSRVNKTSELINRARVSRDPGLRAEVYTYCSVFRYEEAEKVDPICFDQARELITEAHAYYKSVSDVHRCEVTGYILSIILHPFKEFWESSILARDALSYFIKGIDFQNLDQSASINPQRKRAQEITCDLLSSPTDMFACLFLPNHKSRLSSSALQIQDHLRKRIEDRTIAIEKNTRLINLDMKCLVDITHHGASDRDKQETGEALAYCGIVNWILYHRFKGFQKLNEAAAYELAAAQKLDESLDYYEQSDWEYPMIRWIVGQIRADLFLNEKEGKEDIGPVGLIINSLERSVRDIKEFRDISITKGLEESFTWYSCLYSSMKISLQNLADKICEEFEKAVV